MRRRVRKTQTIFQKAPNWYMLSSIPPNPLVGRGSLSSTMATNLYNLTSYNKDFLYKHQVLRNLALTNSPSSTSHVPKKLPLQHPLSI